MQAAPLLRFGSALAGTDGDAGSDPFGQADRTACEGRALKLPRSFVLTLCGVAL